MIEMAIYLSSKINKRAPYFHLLFKLLSAFRPSAFFQDPIINKIGTVRLRKLDPLIRKDASHVSCH